MNYQIPYLHGLRLRVVTGHGPESIEGKETNLNIQKFYSCKYTEQEEIHLLKKYKVSYVVWGPVEQKIGLCNPYANDYLKPVYQSGDYSVFQVISQ